MYVIGSDPCGPVKLGISADPPRRVSDLQTGHAHRLHLYHSESVCEEKAPLFERLLHRDVGYLRTHGEWFRLTVEQAIAHIQYTIIQYDGIEDLPMKVKKRRV